MLVLFMGTIDEEYLIGKKVEGSEEETAMGVKTRREGGFAKDLSNMKMGHLFWNNVIAGVTDHDIGEGPRFSQSFPQD